MASSAVSSLKQVLVYTLLGRHHIIHFNYISPTWLLGLCQNVWPTGIQYMFLFRLFLFFCISPSAYFCHIVKLLIKKETTKLSNCFLPPLFAVSVGLITTNYNQQPLSSLLKTKCQKDNKPCSFLWMIKSPVVQVRLHLNLNPLRRRAPSSQLKISSHWCHS